MHDSTWLTQTQEAKAFRDLQRQFDTHYRDTFGDPRAPRTVIVLPSLTLDQEVLSRITGVHHYEERLLCLLLLLRLPRTHVIYLTSQPIPDVIVDYYLNLLPGVPHQHARDRLTMLPCYDGSRLSLTEKVLRRPRLIEKLSSVIPDTTRAHMACFTVSEHERKLALALRVPVFGCDPDLQPLGSKSGGRKIMREAGINLPDGFEDLRDARDVAQGLYAMKRNNPAMRKAVVKINEGFSGEGNALFRYGDAPESAEAIEARLPDLEYVAKDMTWEVFSSKIDLMGAIVEAFVEGENKESPSAQFRIVPGGDVEILSTHDQVLGGHGGQIFLGAKFPAQDDYRMVIQEQGRRVAECMAGYGVLGRLGVDFISVCEGGTWSHYGIEINLRMGGTSHPFIMLQFLTDGSYDEATGLYLNPAGRPCYYYTSDNLENPNNGGMTPDDLIDMAVMNDLHFHAASHDGVVFHLLGALSEFGKLGVLCVGPTPQRSEYLFNHVAHVLASDRQ